MYQPPGSQGEYKTPNRGLRREAFRSHFLLFIVDTIIMTGLLVCGIIGVIWMNGELYSTPPFYVASFVAATVVMAKATVGGCFSVQGLFVKEKPDEPETALVILHLILSVISMLGYFVAIVVFGASRVLESCASSNDTPGCSNHAQVYKALGAITLVLILISIALTCFGIYLFVRFGKEFGVSPYKKSKWRKDPPRSVSKTISVHHNEVHDDMKDFV
ncbi:uncharacterized protein LOC134690349 [Mytilus trossulus]|uniref:uncharacterized protein LOC134690349 n=1 Tax=Mytilus trossulus TaxID=6551 RepID=UPI00300742A0